MMKILIIYNTMGGRTKRVAEIIGNNLPGNDVTFARFELIGKYLEKIKILDLFEHDDFSLIQTQLDQLDAQDCDLILIGMPTYGNFPPKVFNAVLKHLKNIENKKVVVFATARFTGKKSLDYMINQIEAQGAEVVHSHNFRGLFVIGKKSILQFANECIKMR